MSGLEVVSNLQLGCSFCSGVQLVRDAEVKCVLKMNR